MSAAEPHDRSRALRIFRDRRDAGRVLAGLLGHHRGRSDVVVLGLPRGGVPVAYEVARALGAPLDVFLVRKLRAPGRDELAMGAIASGGVLVVNDDVVRGLDIPYDVIQRAAEQERRELLKREQVYREGRPMPDLAGRTVVLVDDGIATGSSIRAAIRALRQLEPRTLVAAVPVGPRSGCRNLATIVDEAVCATSLPRFVAVGCSYQDFGQTPDAEVEELLRLAAAREGFAGPAGR